MSYRKHLTASGISDTRAFELSLRIGALHQSIAQLDARNLALIEELHPGVVEMVDQYAEKEGGGLRRFVQEDEMTGLTVLIVNI